MGIEFLNQYKYTKVSLGSEQQNFNFSVSTLDSVFFFCIFYQKRIHGF